MSQEDIREQQEYEKAQLEQQRSEEEQIQLNARLALLELETSGKQYFKPVFDKHYFLTFDRKQVSLVRGTPSEKLKRKVQDKVDKNIIHEVPATEWIHEVTHENGDVQTWSVLSKPCHQLILEETVKGFSTVEFWKEKTGPKTTDVEYHVKGVRK